tara:strand:+ start:371 stop:1399 length:1029 start_codon:yes stop_codon:yes gene_type:complete
VKTNVQLSRSILEDEFGIPNFQAGLEKCHNGEAEYRSHVAQEFKNRVKDLSNIRSSATNLKLGEVREILKRQNNINDRLCNINFNDTFLSRIQNADPAISMKTLEYFDFEVLEGAAKKYYRDSKIPVVVRHTLKEFSNVRFRLDNSYVWPHQFHDSLCREILEWSKSVPYRKSATLDRELWEKCLESLKEAHPSSPEEILILTLDLRCTLPLQPGYEIAVKTKIAIDNTRSVRYRHIRDRAELLLGTSIRVLVQQKDFDEEEFIQELCKEGNFSRSQVINELLGFVGVKVDELRHCAKQVINSGNDIQSFNNQLKILIHSGEADNLIKNINDGQEYFRRSSG